MYALVDYKMFYIHNLETYAGKQPIAPHVSNNQDIISKFAVALFGTGQYILLTILGLSVFSYCSFS